MTPEELEQCIARAADGTLTNEESVRLAAVCRADPEALKRLAAHLITERLIPAVERDPDGRIAAQEALLRLEQERIAAVTEPSFIPRVTKGVGRRVWSPRLALAATVLLLAGLAIVFLNKRTLERKKAPFTADGPISERVATATPMAVLNRAVEVQWSDSENAPTAGAMLTAGWVRIRSGVLQLEFLGGARLLVEGPAELRLDSNSSALLKTGKASAYVPESARGFTLNTPDMKVVDLGTSFGVEVSPGRDSEVHVFNGWVSVQPADLVPRKLEGGHAVRLVNGELQDIAASPAKFPNGEQLAKQADTSERNRLQKWRAASEQLAADTKALLTYTFEDEDEWSRSVLNIGTQATTESHGSLVGAGWTGGRWPGKKGLEFRSLGDRLRFSVPGQHNEITLLAWIRVDSLPNDYNSLILPSRYENGSIHWTLERGGELRLTMLTLSKQPFSARSWNGPVSGPAVSNLDFGRWLFVATTYDSATGTVVHYRDGQQVGKGQFVRKLPAVLGPVEFGNWGADGNAPDNAWIKNQQPNHRTRNFVGRLDELAVLARVMSQDEILRLYEAGKP
jgi:hypothetical protein